MSRIGEKPIAVPGGVTVTIDGRQVAVKGPKGTLSITLPRGVKVVQDGAELRFQRESDLFRAEHGLARSLVANMLIGVVSGYTKELEINGVGFRAALSGQTLSLSLGFASPVEFLVPDTVKVTVVNNTAVTVTGLDKQQVGDVAARIRSFYPAEPYKGKGIQYKGERVRRKVGKTVA
jgi:large subunit ribosomal protein L6